MYNLKSIRKGVPMKKYTFKRVISMLLGAALLLQSGGVPAFAADAQYSDELQKVSVTQLPFTETGIETQRTSDDATLLTIYNTVKNQAPTLSADGSKIVLPATGDENYAVTLYGSSNQAVIDMDGNVTQPLEDMQVYLYYRVTNLTTGEELHMDDPLIVNVNGLYEDSQCTINRPRIMPGIREWKGNEGTFSFSGNIVIADDTLAEASDVVKSYIEGMTDLQVTVISGTPDAGDIYLGWDKDLTVGKEGYVLDIDDVLTVKAPEYVGIVYAGATITQMLMSGCVPKGVMRDYPQYEVRSTMLDVARFYMPLDYLEEVTMYAAFFKINEFHAHINDNNGEQNHAFRIESKRYPVINSGIPENQVYSQEDYKQYQKNVRKYGIDVVTEIDTPAHSRFVSAYNQDYMLTDTMIDITGENADEVIGFIKSLFDEFLDGDDPVFQSEKVHIGMDEYDYAYGEQIRQYSNELADYVSAKGYEPRMWCSMAKTEPATTKITNTAVQHHYLSSAANVQDLLSGEYPIIVNNSKYLYVVPVTDDRVSDRMDVELCYNDWEAGKMNRPSGADEILQPGHPLLLGSESAIWYDDKVGCSEFDYFSRYKDHVMMMAEKNWFGKNLASSSYAEFTERIEMYSDMTPLVNPGRYVKSQTDLIAQYDFGKLDGTSVVDQSGNGYHASVTNLTVQSGALVLDGAGFVSLPFNSVGFPYSVDFTLLVDGSGENAVLFDGNDGKLFLNYDGTGKLGIERKGYRYTFDYVIPSGVPLDYRLVCENEVTTLFVEGVRIGEAQLYKTTIETEGGNSFVLPTERIGAGVNGLLYSLRIARKEMPIEQTGEAAADKTALKDCLEEIADVRACSAETAAAYQRALEMGKTVYETDGVTQNKVDWAVGQIEATKAQLSVIHSVIYDNGICPHCGKKAAGIQWKPWNYGAGSYVGESGHYYLDRDIEFSGSQIRIGLDSSGTEGTTADVVLDLNGHSITATARRCFYIFTGSKLSVMDSVGAGAACGGYSGSGGAIYIEPKATFDLWSGTLTSTVETTASGGVVQNAGGSFTMYSGIVYGGTAAAPGGNIYVKNGTFVMKGGTVLGGDAKTGTAASAGGNIYAGSNSTVQIYDGLIVGGTSTDVGGNIAINESTLEIYGGTIRDGFALSGGNIGCSGTSVFYMEGGYITAGVAQNYGGNFRMNKSASSFTVAGGVIDGDISVNANMKLSGSPEIRLGSSNGLHLIGTKKLDVSQLNSDARIFVSRTANGVFTTGYDAQIHGNCFYGAIRSTISQDSTGQLSADNTNEQGYCPHCGQIVKWQPVTFASGEYFTGDGHFYLTAGITNISSMIRIGEQVASENAVVLDLNGKTISAAEEKTVRVFYVNTELSLLDSAGLGKVTGRATANGGTIYTGTNARLYIYSGSLLAPGNATGANGGVIATNGETIIYGGQVNGSGFTSCNRGAAIHGARGILQIHGGRIVGGTAAEGGTVYYNGDNGKAFTLTGGVITGGISTGLGGNVYIGNESVFNMYGGVLADGTGDTGNTNENYNADNVYIDSERSMKMSGGYILGANSDAQGNGVLCWTKASMVLDGDARIFNTKKAGNLYIASSASLTVKEGFRGQVYAFLQAKHLKNPVYGGRLTGGGAVQDSAEGVFTGSLFLENDAALPGILGTDDGHLVVAGAAAVNHNGGIQWCLDADAAAKLCGLNDKQIVRLYAAENVISMEGTHTVDLNGKNLTVSGGQVFCLDTGNSDYVSFGKATATGSGEVANVFATTVDGQTYYMLRDADGSYSFHKLSMQVSGVSLRPSAAGIYYKGNWKMDDSLKSKVKSYGVAVSLTDMPAEDFDDDTLWTALDPDSLESGKSQTSVLIENILKPDAQDNDARGKNKIYAAAYVVLDDGTEDGYTVITDTVISYSLYDVVKLLDESAYTENQEALEAFYAAWEDVMSTWGFTNIGVS